MRTTKRQLKRIIQEVFAATAQEEAERVNAQAGPNEYGMSLVTDQSFWEDQGIYTGEDLAISLVAGTYSEMHKAIHGRRPRRNFETFEEAQEALEDLERYYDDMVERDEIEAREQAEYERNRAELEALMPTEIEKQYDPMPRHSGMGRRAESVNRRGRILREDSIARVSEDLHRALDEYVTVLFEELGQLSEGEVRAEVLNFVDGFLENISDLIGEDY